MLLSATITEVAVWDWIGRRQVGDFLFIDCNVSNGASIDIGVCFVLIFFLSRLLLPILGEGETGCHLQAHDTCLWLLPKLPAALARRNVSRNLNFI